MRTHALRRPQVATIGGLLVLSGLAVGFGARPVAAAAAGYTQTIHSSGTTSFTSAAAAPDGVQHPEIATQAGGPDAGAYDGTIVDRTSSGGPSGQTIKTNGALKAKSTPQLVLSFDGLNHRQQRLANGGNQFSVEPPDQGLCVGGGFVMETVNDVLRIFDTSGHALIGVTDLNTFYGYIPAINRSTGVRGPFVTDPSCLYDAATRHWFVDVLTLDSRANGSFIGTNHLDLAVSQTSDPTGLWTIYRLPVQDDGTGGTPNHGCSLGPCLGDYPHIGADLNGLFLTTNEYSFFGPEFHGAQVYAFSKSALASGASSVLVTQFDTHGFVAGVSGVENGFTLWPSTTPGGLGAIAANGTEYFMSSNAAAEATDPGTGSSTARASSQLLVWAMTNTGSLSTAAPALALSYTGVGVNQYAAPPTADQKTGDFPLGQCLNNTACSTFLNGTTDPFAPEVESRLDSNDTRMQQVTYANGKLWGALDTTLTINNVNKAGIEWFILKPVITGSAVTASLAMQGYLGLANNNLTYPAIGVSASGRGIMAFTVVGADYFPSAGYASIDSKVGVGPVAIAAAGLGPDDGFTSYKFYVGNPPRTRWGDYGATAIDGTNIWIASEYIGQTCTLATYETAPFGSCGGTRSSLGNWDTRISHLTVG
jgi:hypothetical protein